MREGEKGRRQRNHYEKKERKKIKEIITNKKKKVKEERGENNYINVPSFPGELASTFDGFPGGERSYRHREIVCSGSQFCCTGINRRY